MTSAFTHQSSMVAIESESFVNDRRPVPIRIDKVNRIFLAKAIRTGASLRLLSRVLNISVHHVYYLCLHYGLAAGGKLSQQLIDSIRQQAQAGKSLVQLAQQHHISYYRVAAIVQIPTDKKPPAGAADPMRHHKSSRPKLHPKCHREAAPFVWRKGSKPAA